MRLAGVFLVSAFALLALASCSAGIGPAPEASGADVAVESIELYLSRGQFINAPEFEQYALRGDTLYRECGVLTRGRAHTSERKVERLSEEQLEAVRTEGADLYRYLEGRDPDLPEPGRSNSMFDPGEAYLTVQTSSGSRSVKTTTDAVSSPSRAAEKKILALVETLRGASPVMCGNPHFFSIGRR